MTVALLSVYFSGRHVIVLHLAQNCPGAFTERAAALLLPSVLASTGRTPTMERRES